MSFWTPSAHRITFVGDAEEGTKVPEAIFVESGLVSLRKRGLNRPDSNGGSSVPSSGSSSSASRIALSDWCRLSFDDLHSRSGYKCNCRNFKSQRRNQDAIGHTRHLLLSIRPSLGMPDIWQLAAVTLSFAPEKSVASSSRPPVVPPGERLTHRYCMRLYSTPLTLLTCRRCTYTVCTYLLTYLLSSRGFKGK